MTQFTRTLPFSTVQLADGEHTFSSIGYIEDLLHGRLSEEKLAELLLIPAHSEEQIRFYCGKEPFASKPCKLTVPSHSEETAVL